MLLQVSAFQFDTEPSSLELEPWAKELHVEDCGPVGGLFRCIGDMCRPAAGGQSREICESVCGAR